MHAVLPLAFAYLGAGSKYNEEAVRRGAHQLRGQTEQGVTLVGEEEPGGQSALHVAEAVAEVSVDVPEGQGRHDVDALDKEYDPAGHRRHVSSS